MPHIISQENKVCGWMNRFLKICGIICLMRGRKNITISPDEYREHKNQSSRESHARCRRQRWYQNHTSDMRKSLNPPPSLEDLKAAFARRRESCAAIIKLGSMIEDAQCEFGMGYENDGLWGDNDAPWQPGITGYLKADPLLSSKYKTLMRYKEISAWFRYVLDLPSEVPAIWVVDHRNDKRVRPFLEKADRILAEAKPCYTGLMRRIKEELCRE